MLLCSCAPPTKVAVEERTVFTVKQQTEEIGGQLIRRVKKGDTLHGIAFEYNLDIVQLAGWNAISDTSRLFVGQRVRLTKPIGFVAKSAPRLSSRQATTTTHSSAVTSSSREARDSANEPVRKQNAQTQATNRNQGGNKQGAIRDNTTLPKTDTSRSTAGISWAWPLNGKVIRRFSPSSTQQGVDILGTIGEKVRASASGEVVYVGDSLKGYGNLIIIKHDDIFLSAYAHNQKTWVAEGQKVARTEVIGSVGINNRGESALHLQIRFKGKPVNPLNYLPAI